MFAYWPAASWYASFGHETAKNSGLQSLPAIDDGAAFGLM